jgi:hypothetical protein
MSKPEIKVEALPQYKLLEVRTDVLSSSVTEHLREGWELYGSPTTQVYSGWIYKYQAVVKNYKGITKPEA